MRFLLFIIFALISVGSGAQENKYGMTGRVVDKEGMAVMRASVTLTMAGGSAFRRQTVADDNGVFSFSALDNGNYELKITYIGLADYISDITVKGNTDLGNIRMDDSAEMLEGITVMANYTRQKRTGETIVKVKGNPLTKGKSTQDFLKYVRGIDVTESSLSLNGKQNTLIYLEDRKISFDQLKSIPPSMIEDIEIIPFADGSYGEKATGGVVKIHLRQEGGLIGSATVYGGMNTEDLYGESPRLNLLYTKGKFTINNYLTAFEYGKYPDILTKEYNSSDDSYTYKHNTTRYRIFGDNLSLRYAFNKTDRIDLYGGVSASWNRTSKNSISGNDTLDIKAKPISRAYSIGTQYRKGLGNGGENFLNMRIDYSKSKYDNGQEYNTNGMFDNARQNYDIDFVTVSPYAHFKFNDKMNLTAGLEYYYMSNMNNNRGTKTMSYIEDGKFCLNQDYYSAWAEYSLIPSKSLFLKFGMRYSGTNEKYKDYLDSSNNFERWQDGICPSLSGQWTIDENKMRYLNISYRRMFYLPNYGYRIPNVTWQGDDLYSIGNTDLKKEVYDDVELYFSLNRRLSFSYSMSYGSDIVSVIMHKDENRPGVYYTRPENSAYSMQQSLTMNYTGRIFSFWHTNTSIAYLYRHSRSGENKINHGTFTFRSNNDFKINKYLGLTLNMTASSKNRTESYDENARFKMDVSGYVSLMKGKMNVSLLYENILYNTKKLTMFGEGWEKRRTLLTPDSHVVLFVTWNFTAGKKINNQTLPTVKNKPVNTPTF